MVSVLVPVYNKTQEELTRCFDSILNQTCKDFELIITDDGSKSEIAVFLDNYVENNKIRCSGGVHCYHYPNGGVWTARNRGQEKSSGEWIMHINADDFIDLVTIEIALKTVIEYKDVDMVYWRFWNENWPLSMYKGDCDDKFYKNPKKEKLYISPNIVSATPFCDVTCMVRRAKAELFNPDLIGAEFERQVRVIAGCNAVYFLNKPLYNYVIGEKTISATVDLHWRISALKDFRNALIFHNFDSANDQIHITAIAIVHSAYHTSKKPFKVLKEINKSVVGEIIRSVSLKGVNYLTKEMKVHWALFRAKQFILLSIVLSFQYNGLTNRLLIYNRFLTYLRYKHPKLFLTLRNIKYKIRGKTPPPLE